MRALGLGTLVIAMLAIPALLDHDSGVSIWLELREDLAHSNGRVDALVTQNESLRREIELLEADPTAVDRAIREELDLAMPGDVIVRFLPESGVGNLPASPSYQNGRNEDRESR